MPDWKTWHQTAEMENAKLEKCVEKDALYSKMAGCDTVIDLVWLNCVV